MAWTGYIRIKKAIALTAGDIAGLNAMGSGQTPDYPNLRTFARMDAGNVQAIVELQSPVEPIEGDVPFGLTEFQVFAGATWLARCTAACAYIIANAGAWGE